MRTTILLLVVGAGSFFSQAAAADAPRQEAKTFDKPVPVMLRYLLYLPKDYDQKDAWPLVIFLHGAGERGDDLQKVKVHGPPKLIEAGQDFPAIVVSPQCAQGRWWTTQMLELSALIDDIEANYKVDKRRVYLTGLSMGGYGTWSLAAYSPQRFAALVPVCGGGEPRRAAALRNTPIWVFHGAKDAVVPLAQSEEMVEALKRSSGNVKFTVYPEAGHDSWTETYDNPEVWKWLFEQQLPPK
jgi:predicted peptidase